MSDRSHRIAAVTLATIGVLMLGGAAVIQLIGAVRGHTYEIPRTVFYVAAVIGFVGFYGLDPKRAKDGGSFIVDSAVRIIGVVRNGRRSSDVAVVAVPVVRPGDEPEPPAGSPPPSAG